MNYVFSPQYISKRRYKTKLQILKDFWSDKSETIAWTVIIALVAGYMISHMIRVDKQSYKAATWEVQNQRTGEVGTGSMILNPNYKVQ